MTMLGDFCCKNRKPGSGWECNLGLECPRVYEDCDAFDPDGEVILDAMVEMWLYEAQKGDGVTDAMVDRLEAAIKRARLK